MKSQTPRRSTRTGRRTPWTPIFDSRKRKGDILVGDTPAYQWCGWDGGSASTQGSDSLDFGTASTQGTDTIDFNDLSCLPPPPAPVLAFDSRDWSGGAAVPTSSQLTRLNVGTIPNTGTAGSDYDITVWMIFRENGVDGWVAADVWDFNLMYLSTAAPTGAFTIPGTFWDDLGGTPMSPAGWTMCAVAGTVAPSSGSFDVVSIDIQDTSNQAAVFMSVGYDENGDLDLQAAAYDNDVPSELNYAVSNDAAVGEPMFTAMAYDMETGASTFYLNAGTVTLDTDTTDITPAVVASVDAIAPDAAEIGWTSGNGVATEPAKGTAFPGLSAWRLYRGSLTAAEIAAVRAEMEA